MQMGILRLCDPSLEYSNMTTDSKTILPELFPAVKQIIINEGMTDLSEDVRLVTSNVLPLQRKTMRSILSLAGIKVVANKKNLSLKLKLSINQSLI